MKRKSDKVLFEKCMKKFLEYYHRKLNRNLSEISLSTKEKIGLGIATAAIVGFAIFYFTRKKKLYEIVALIPDHMVDQLREELKAAGKRRDYKTIMNLAHSLASKGIPFVGEHYRIFAPYDKLQSYIRFLSFINLNILGGKDTGGVFSKEDVKKVVANREKILSKFCWTEYVKTTTGYEDEYDKYIGLGRKKINTTTVEKPVTKCAPNVEYWVGAFEQAYDQGTGLIIWLGI